MLLMLNRHGLRFRISVTFFVLAGFLSAMFAWGISLVVERIEHRYVESTLEENLTFIVDQRRRNPTWSLPHTATLRGYAVPLDRTSELPAYLAAFGPGTYEYEDDVREYQIAIRDDDNVRYAVVFDESGFDELEEFVVVALATGVALVSFIAIWLGGWTADRIIAPVTNLARQIRGLGDDLGASGLRTQWGDDEVAELAGAFEHYLSRVRSLVRREREFTANVSHELRTPIMVASSGVDLLLSGPDLDEATRRQLVRLHRAVRQMASLTDAFLILGREARTAEHAGAETAVEPTLREVIEFRRETAERKDLNLSLIVEGSPTVHAPSTAVSVVLDNLVGNAVTYTEGGEVAVTLGDKGVTISDTGRGIFTDDQAKVFEREFRGRNASPGGAGLGLSIVRALCDHYGWRVSLESSEGYGTTARLEFAAS